MIKMLVSAHKKPELSERQYSDYWSISHGALVRQYGQAMGFKRYVQTHLIPVELPPALVGTEGTDKHKSGQAELWWDSVETMLSAGATDEGRVASDLFEEDEKRFCDVANLSAFLAEETVLLDIDPSSRFSTGDVKLIVDLWRRTGAPDYQDWLAGHIPHFDTEECGSGLKRYIANFPVDDDRFNFAHMRGWKPAPDASIEMWFTDKNAFVRAMSGEGAAHWKADIARFADTGRLRPLIGQPRLIFDAASTG